MHVMCSMCDINAEIQQIRVMCDPYKRDEKVSFLSAAVKSCLVFVFVFVFLGPR